MIYLICGEKNGGKTTRLKQMFHSVENAYGFYADKEFEEGTLVAYNLVNLRGGAIIPLAKILSKPGGCASKSLIHGHFCFNMAGFLWARELFEVAKLAKAAAFFIDEVGEIELSSRGHSELVRVALNSIMDIYITVRNSKFKDIIYEFGIREYTRIKIR